MLFTEIATAYKRALHWWPEFDPADGPHTALRHPIGSNYSMILDGADDGVEYLCHLHEFARVCTSLHEGSTRFASTAWCEITGRLRRHWPVF